ncbi:alkaline phosphatase D family protein [Alterisphingorhabdus coralli]|uniref:Alkaline phosphatase D family protein n=1 Tax=Alterisphingorhabdus coralli TaxID=3071408 RepID=A0AA97F9Q4_9SPHN|nr:alkaline phosphatase D family protein [Parasphingorhabdus sp. SCSIO 66989]WOE75847.1 alkaline phosphatase D family protein [Parasphingorhabdus sp. SCSIO 66989]
MNGIIDRRFILKAGTMGLGALALPGIGSGIARAFENMTGFTHGVASGEPSASSVLLWTRYVGTSDSKLDIELSTSPDFTEARQAGTAMASAERDFTAKSVVSGLEPNSWYFYRFVAPDGSKSVIGRTRTLPVGDVSRFALGVFSCSNLPFGHFNAYAHAAARNDLDLMLHLGDYIYEYAIGTYPSVEQALPGRILQPDTEILTLADYRLRYAAYRTDPDLQRLHQAYPMLAMWDDHEITNDSWKNGAQNHQPDEGDYQTRRRIAERVYREWMPVRDLNDGGDLWSSYDIGQLATIIMTESRLAGRDQQVELASAFKGEGDIAARLKTFRDDVWMDPNRSVLGEKQSKWLGKEFARSKGGDTVWQVWGQQCVMGSLKSPPETANWIPDNAPDYVRTRALGGVMAAQAGLPFNMDSWDGYPVARAAHLSAAMEADSDLIVLSGDSHNGWAFDLDVEGRPAGVEFATHSVSSPGFEAYTKGVAPNDVSNALVRANDQLKWADTNHRGYMTVTLSPESAEAEWLGLDTIRERSTKMTMTQKHRVMAGAKTISA